MGIQYDPEYVELKKCFKALYPLVAPDVQISPEQHPFAMIEKLEALSPSRARTGLKMALNDMVEMASNFSPEHVRKIDQILGLAGVLTLTALRLKYSRAVSRILKRGSINREMEYQLLKGIVDSGIANDAQVAQIDAMLIAYDERTLERTRKSQ